MNKLSFLYIAAVVFVCSVVSSSCRKPYHASAPTPANSRLTAYTKTITAKPSISTAIPTPINENYRFFYDNSKRLSQIIFSTNSAAANPDNIGYTITFEYSHDSIFKTFINTMHNVVTERDTFVKNSLGLIVGEYLPGHSNTFEYYGNLIDRRTENYYTSFYADGFISKSTIYTSYNGDLLALQDDGKLTYTFYGLTPTVDYPDTVIWTDGVTLTTTTHTHSSGNTDILSGYIGHPVSVIASDYYGLSDTSSYPGFIFQNETYQIYPNDDNRVGDYMQIESFTKYGQNIYNNTRLLRSITKSGSVNKLSYVKDANSRITETTSVLTDSIANVTTTVYKLQYEDTY